MKIEKVIVKAAVYNNYKDVLFMMEITDFRLTDPRFSGNYTHVTTGTYKSKIKRFYGTDGHEYQVFSDWSVKSD